MLDLRDSVQKGRDLDVPDDGGATAVSTVIILYPVCLKSWGSTSL